MNCSDLGSQAAAQTYFDGRTGDLDHLDGDRDGQACEGNAPHTGGTWTLILLGVLFAAGLARYTTFTKDAEAQSAEAPAGGRQRRRPGARSSRRLSALLPLRSAG